MPPPLDALARLVVRPDAALSQHIDTPHGRASLQFALFDLLRREQAVAVGSDAGGRSEISRTLDFAQSAYGDLVGLLVGRRDAMLQDVRDGDWTLRDVLRHAIAVELRYGAQVRYSATRADGEPLAIPDGLLPCDRISPPEPDFVGTRHEGITRMLELMGTARAATDSLLASLSDRVLARPTVWGSLPFDVRTRLHQIAAHIAETVIQIEKVLAAGDPDSEARRIIRRCCLARGSHERWSAAPARSVLDDAYRRFANQ